MNAQLLSRLRGIDVGREADSGSPLLSEWRSCGVKFAASAPQMEAQYYRAVRELLSCIKPASGGGPILQEGGVYLGCWLESTGTISAELLSRFLPSVAKETFEAFARGQREDGLLPYKLTADGPVFSQIQLVTPPARSAWTHYRLHGDGTFLRRIYAALGRYDAWLARYRDTRGTGAVEAFCCYDTGHDLSARFWHVPDSPLGNDPARYDPDNPLLPLIAPDLTATVACGRSYLAQMAAELGEDAGPWEEKAAASRNALFAQCHDGVDGFFYDRDRHDRPVRVQSDVLLRVLAAEIGDDAFFAAALERYLLNTRKFFAKYPFTSLALDDPRFDPSAGHNSWSGATNFLSLIRAPHAFEHHNRYVELTFAMQPVLNALFRAPRFAQTLNPYTGEAGFTEVYSPSLLCLIDYIERLTGIMPRPDGTLWFTTLTPSQMEHRDAAHETAYSRAVSGVRFEIVNTPRGSMAWRDGEGLFAAPAGVRVVTDRRGEVRSLVGMRAGGADGDLVTAQGRFPFRIAANEQLDLVSGGLSSVRKPGFVPPTT